ncbi:MAG: hypothetical protein ACFB0B_13020 [Thermonemataceae bacterium]
MKHPFKFIRLSINSLESIRIGFSMIAMLFLVITGCEREAGITDEKPLTLEAEASELLDALETFFPTYIEDLPEGNISQMLEGNNGTARVQGTTNSSGVINVWVTFEDFEPQGVDMRITGTLRFIWANGGDPDVRKAIISLAESSFTNRVFNEIRYRLDSGIWVEDVIDISATSDTNNPGSWDQVLIRTEAGESFSL